MTELAALPDSTYGAAARIAATADDARQLGFENVETRYEPQTGYHTVSGELPAETAQRTVDRILGR
ncbi:hypothetical protein [Kitasatospora aureofaciens]|uniref:hypothetical protein n=1 Tax=Kitasatospora aureofaciens TaxID=1894 RepID=UPI0033ECB00E